MFVKTRSSRTSSTYDTSQILRKTTEILNDKVANVFVFFAHQLAIEELGICWRAHWTFGQNLRHNMSKWARQWKRHCVNVCSKKKRNFWRFNERYTRSFFEIFFFFKAFTMSLLLPWRFFLQKKTKKLVSAIAHKAIQRRDRISYWY